MAASYAGALAESAQASGTLDAIHGDCEKLAGWAESDGDVVSVLSNPVLGDDKKKDLIAKMGKEGGFSPVFVQFLDLLVDKRRADILAQVLSEFEQIYCDLTGTQLATVRSAVKLEDSQQFAIAKHVQARGVGVWRRLGGG